MTITWSLLPVPDHDHAYPQQLIADRQLEHDKPHAPSFAGLLALTGSTETVNAVALAKQPVWPAEAFQQLAWPTQFQRHASAPMTSLPAKVRPEMSGKPPGRGIRKILERNYPDVPRWTYGDYNREKSWPLADASGRHIGEKDQV